MSSLYLLNHFFLVISFISIQTINFSDFVLIQTNEKNHIVDFKLLKLLCSTLVCVFCEV